jgi:SSS family solute:Na+ symporter
MDRVGLVFLACVALAVVASLTTKTNEVEGKQGVVALSEVDFSTKPSFNVLSVGVIVILCALYATWW